MSHWLVRAGRVAMSLMPWLFLGLHDAAFGGCVAFPIATLAIWPESLARAYLSLSPLLRHSPFSVLAFVILCTIPLFPFILE